MKDLTALVTPTDIHSYFRALWRTLEFRDSHASGGYIHQWIDRLAEYPRLVGTLTEPEIERPHFSPWWNVLGRRDYENDAIHDLFYLHEIAHMAMMVYEESIAWHSWASKMADNEMLASLESETLVYLALPSLRAKSFAGRIWADRFLERDGAASGESSGDSHSAARAAHEQELPIETQGGGMRDAAVRAAHRSFMLMERYRARRAPEDDLEIRIAAFQRENEAWARIWERRHREVEGTMCEFRRRASTDRASALEWLFAWHERQAEAGGGVPFRGEAEEFAAVYWESRR